MMRSETITGVPEQLKNQVANDYRSEGATVTVTKQGKTYTIVAVFPKTDPGTPPRATDAPTKTFPAAALAPGEDERPDRSLLEEDVVSGPQSYYPAAVRDLLGTMTTRGHYPKGYPEGAVVHFTAGRRDPRNDIRHAQKHGYCYFVIDPDGVVYQNFPLSHWGSHAGASFWPGLGSGVSRHLVGIEICCAGKLRDLGNGTFRPWYNEADYLAASGRQPSPRDDLPASEVRRVKAQHNRVAGDYHKYTEMQEASLHTLLRWLKVNRPEVFRFDLVLGHDEVAPGRKNDPGGSLSTTMPELRERLSREW